MDDLSNLKGLTEGVEMVRLAERRKSSRSLSNSKEQDDEDHKETVVRETNIDMTDGRQQEDEHEGSTSSDASSRVVSFL